MNEMNLAGFIAAVAAELKRANQEANTRIRETNDEPFLAMGDVQLQVTFTAEQTDTDSGELSFKPYIFSLGAKQESARRDGTFHTVTVNLSPVEPTDSVQSTSTGSSGTSSGDGGSGRSLAGGGGGGGSRFAYAPKDY